MNKRELRQKLDTARQFLLESVEGLTEAEMTTQPVDNDWTVKDILAHIAAWDAEVASAIHALATEKSPRFGYHIDPKDDFREWNAQQVEKRHGLNPAQVMAEVSESRQKLLEIIEGLDEAQLTWFGHVPWGWSASVEELIRVQAEHDEDHAARIREWRA